MLLSIIVPSLNQNRFIESTLDSILAQSYRTFEVLVIDGASSDGTVETLRCYAARYPELRWVSEPDGGPADAINKGLAMARGDIAGIQSADDIYYPGAFDAVIELFNSDPDLGFVIGDYSGLDERGCVLYSEQIPEFSWEAYFARSMSIPQSSIFFRLDVASSIGGWNAAYYCCDLDFWLRLLLRTKAGHVSRVLSGWRLYPGQRTSGKVAARLWSDYRQMIRDCRDLKSAPLRVRRLARASTHLRALRFYPKKDPWAVRGHLLIGWLLHPTFWRYYPWDLAGWLPGVRRLRRLRNQPS